MGAFNGKVFFSVDAGCVNVGAFYSLSGVFGHSYGTSGVHVGGRYPYLIVLRTRLVLIYVVVRGVLVFVFSSGPVYVYYGVASGPGVRFPVAGGVGLLFNPHHHGVRCIHFNCYPTYHPTTLPINARCGGCS